MAENVTFNNNRYGFVIIRLLTDSSRLESPQWSSSPTKCRRWPSVSLVGARICPRGRKKTPKICVSPTPVWNLSIEGTAKKGGGFFIQTGKGQEMSVECSSENWSISLGMRNNLFYDDIPYIPMLVEDISIHCSSEDYQENRIKTIQTLGELVPKTEASATLLSLTPENNSKIPIYFNNLSIEDIYIKNSNNVRCAIWQKYTFFKVYGTLTIMGSEHMLETTHLVPVHDIVGALNIMNVLIPTARSEYHQYYRTEGQNNMLQSQWENMKWEKKRLVKEEGETSDDGKEEEESSDNSKEEEESSDNSKNIF